MSGRNSQLFSGWLGICYRGKQRHQVNAVLFYNQVTLERLQSRLLRCSEIGIESDEDKIGIKTESQSREMF